MGSNFIFIMYMIISVIVVLVGIPLAIKKVPPNLILGFRTPKTLMNDELWYEVNYYTGIELIGTGIFMAIVSYWTYTSGFGIHIEALIDMFACFLGLAVMIFHGIKTINKFEDKK